MIWTEYCGTAAKAGGNGENKRGPAVMGVSCLLEEGGKMELIPYSKFEGSAASYPEAATSSMRLDRSGLC